MELDANYKTVQRWVTLATIEVIIIHYSNVLASGIPTKCPQLPKPIMSFVKHAQVHFKHPNVPSRSIPNVIHVEYCLLSVSF